MKELSTSLEKASTTFSIDHFENTFAICENQHTGKMVSIPISQIEKNAHEGDILTLQNGKYLISETLTHSAKKETEALLQKNKELS